jgi:MSHA pilin protein MshD
LVELIVFIVIVGIAVAGILLALNLSTRASADPLTQKQALGIAEAVLEEVQLQAFTYCDPDDANVATATSPAGCASPPEGAGPEGGEDRYSTVTPFDNVNDYHGFDSNVAAPSGLTGIRDITGNVIAGLGGYRATVIVAEQGLGTIPGPEALLITVTVTGPAGASARLDGYRVRYAPNALP